MRDTITHASDTLILNLEATLALVLGEAARFLTEVSLYAISGVVTVVIVLAYFLRNGVLPDRRKTAVE